MPSYEKIDKGTIEAIVGEKFTIMGRTPIHMVGELSFPQDAFNLIDKAKRPARMIGAKDPVVYTLEPLKPGTYDIEYQRIEPKFGENPEQVSYADIYHVIVSPKG